MIFGRSFSFAFQRAKQHRNPSSYAKVMAVWLNPALNGIFGSRTLIELTCTRSCDWTLQGQRFRSVVRSVGCTHGSDVHSSMVLVVLESLTPARKELVFATFGCNFSLAFQRAKECRNPSSYEKLWPSMRTLRKTVFSVHGPY